MQIRCKDLCTCDTWIMHVPHNAARSTSHFVVHALFFIVDAPLGEMIHIYIFNTFVLVVNG